MVNLLFWKKDSADEIDYSGNQVLKLKMIGGLILVESSFDTITLNESLLRLDGTPRNILNFAINEHPGELITKDDLKRAGINTSRDLRQVAINAGIKYYARDLFMTVCTKDAIQIIREVKVDTRLAVALMENMRT